MTLRSLALHDSYVLMEAWWVVPLVAAVMFFSLIITTRAPAARGSKPVSAALGTVSLLAMFFVLGTVATVVAGHVLHGQYGFSNRALSLGIAFGVAMLLHLVHRSYEEPGFYSHVFVVLALIACTLIGMLFAGMTALARSIYTALF